MTHIESIPENWEFPQEGSPLPPESISFLQFLIDKVFDDYEPSQFHPFRERLMAWLQNVEEDVDRQMLLSLLLKTFFVGRREFEALYRTTYQNVFFRWISDTHELDPFSSGVENEFRKIVNSAWICPISDSLRINSFLKVNGLKSRDKRPDWRSLKELGDPQKIKNYVEEKKIEDLILLEDFVGSGTQAAGAVDFASGLLPHVNILLAPLVVCPSGDRALKKQLAAKKNVTYVPTILLPSGEIHDFDAYERGDVTDEDKFIVRMNEKLGIREEKKAFGYKQTGAKVVMYSNCPNNTLPIFHGESGSWRPLFPRVDRQ